MILQIHDANSLILHMKENEAQRGAVTCFKATELKRVVDLSLPAQ